MENINIKKIEYLIYENNSLEAVIKERINNYENIFNNNETQQIIFNQNNKIRDLERKNKSLVDIYNSLNILYPLKYRQN
jgi:hypothetical protein